MDEEESGWIEPPVKTCVWLSCLAICVALFCGTKRNVFDGFAFVRVGTVLAPCRGGTRAITEISSHSDMTTAASK